MGARYYSTKRFPRRLLFRRTSPCSSQYLALNPIGASAVAIYAAGAFYSLVQRDPHRPPFPKPPLPGMADARQITSFREPAQDLQGRLLHRNLSNGASRHPPAALYKTFQYTGVPGARE